MNELLQRGTRAGARMALPAAAGFALALTACAQPRLDDVKPTATTAYHSTQPAAPQPSPAAGAIPSPPRE